MLNSNNDDCLTNKISQLKDNIKKLQPNFAPTKKSEIALITFGTHIFNFSVNSISSYLRSKNIKIDTIHMVAYDGEGDDIAFKQLTNKQLEILAEHCKTATIIGLSLPATHYLNQAIQVNNYLRNKLNIPIIWGGVPVICDLEAHLKYADYVCVGEGEVFLENCLYALNKAEKINNLPGIAYKSNGDIVRNPTIPLVDVNQLPTITFDFDNHYFLKESLVSLRNDPTPVLTQSYNRGYRVYTIRGCLFQCSYCSNNKLHEVYGGHKRLRILNNKLIMDELRYAKSIIPDLKKISFYEDDFFIRDEKEIEQLMTNYKKEIDLPIDINSTIRQLTANKVDIILDKGIKINFLRVGIQSGSKRVNREIYKRPFDEKQYFEKIPMLIERKVPTTIDMISSNPFERKKDKIENINFLYKLSRALCKTTNADKYLKITDHILLFYPGTELTVKAYQQKLIPPDYTEKVLLSQRCSTERKTDLDKMILSIFMKSLKNKFYLTLMKFPKMILFIDKIRHGIFASNN